MNEAGAESLMLDLRGGVFESLGFCIYNTIIYQQPFTDTGVFLCNLERHVLRVRNFNHIIVGDINIDTLKSDLASLQYLDILSCANVSNVTTIPTRIKSCIDHINMNFKDKLVTPETIVAKISNHLSPLISFGILGNQFKRVTKSFNFAIRNKKIMLKGVKTFK